MLIHRSARGGLLLVGCIAVLIAACGGEGGSSTVSGAPADTNVGPDTSQADEVGARMAYARFMKAFGDGDYETACTLVTPEFADQGGVEPFDPALCAKTFSEAFDKAVALNGWTEAQGEEAKKLQARANARMIKAAESGTGVRVEIIPHSCFVVQAPGHDFYDPSSCEDETYHYRAEIHFDKDPEVPISATGDLQWNAEQETWLVAGPGVD